MNVIKVKDLNVGHIFTKAAYIDEDTLFMPKGIPVRENDLKRLSDWGVETLLSEGSFKKKSGSDLIQFWGVPTDPVLCKFYSNSMTLLDAFFTEIEKGEIPQKKEVEVLSKEILQQINKKKDQAIQMILLEDSFAQGIAKSSMNTAILSILIGRALDYSEDQLYILTQSALLHDVGMLRVSSSLRDKKTSLTPQDFNELSTHTVHSYKVITKELGFSDSIGDVALQHHERWDGQGYPRGKKGLEILEASRILSVTDAFEAMVTTKPYRDSMIGYEAMRCIISDNGRRFDPDILKLFIQVMGIYPLGSVVLLNDSSVGRVVKINREAPLRPLISVLIDKDQKSHGTDSLVNLDLSNRRELFIVKAVDLNNLLKEHDQSFKGEMGRR